MGLKSRISRGRRGPSQSTGAGAPKARPEALNAFTKGLAEVVAIVREMLSIAGAVALGAAQRIGEAELVVLRRAVLPAWRAGRSAAATAMRVGARELTPARGLAAVSLVAIAVLAVSQFVEYREVRAGVPAYAGVDEVAGAPRVDDTVQDTGEAHAYVPLLIAAAALAILAVAMRGRWRLARLLSLAGLVVIAIGILLDAPKGLDEGVLSIQFEGAEARLLSGFWTQIAAAAVLVVTGPLLAAQLNPQRRSTGAQAPAGPSLFARAARRRPFRGGSGSPPQGART